MQSETNCKNSQSELLPYIQKSGIIPLFLFAKTQFMR